ncbi:MAG: hypothetical protein K6F68_05000 [Clostridiales bacterium]|nr:hypothetical protein [Clostridiales bacterium]
MLIEIASVPFEAVLRYPHTELFFRGYETDKPPLFTVEPTEADLVKVQADIDAAAVRGGEKPVRRTPSSLEFHAVHALLARKLISYNVLLMHGSALAIDGEAIVFTAKSGTGKSTHARLWREAFPDRVRMINDDKPLIRIEDGRALVYGSPWNGKHHLGMNACAPLKAVVFLSRGEKNAITPVSRADAFPALVKQCLSSVDPMTAGKILELEMKLLNEAAFFGLQCSMSPEAALVAYEGIMNEPTARPCDK